MTDVFLTDSASKGGVAYCDNVFKFERGSGGILENIVVDFEGPWPSSAYVWCDVGDYIGSLGTRLTLRNFVAGSLGAQTALVRLAGPDKEDPKHGIVGSLLLLENSGPFPPMPPGVEIAPNPPPGIWKIVRLTSSVRRKVTDRWRSVAGQNQKPST